VLPPREAMGYHEHSGAARGPLSLNESFLTEAQLQQLGFAKFGRNVLVHPLAVLVDCAGICLGDHVRIDPFCVLSAKGGVEIGSYTHIGSNCTLSGAGRLVLEDFSCLSHGVKLFSSRDDFSGETMTNSSVPAELRNVLHGDLRIGRHVVVGAGTVIMPGVTIGEGCAVGALSFVEGTLEPWGIYAGIPARRIRERKKDLLALEAALPDRGL
jgi:carbonic anhydrase/acetyltransferase-like protein (isoleucine patch superfamily)